jgi:hypothetical protein
MWLIETHNVQMQMSNSFASRPVRGKGNGTGWGLLCGEEGSVHQCLHALS